MTQVDCRDYLQKTEKLERLILEHRMLKENIYVAGITEPTLEAYNNLEQKIGEMQLDIRISEREILLYDCATIA